MPSVNRIIIVGNLGGEPEMRFTPAGQPTTTFRVATNHRYTTAQGERREETEWFRVVTWSKLAELCNQYLGKGRLVFVEGRLRSSTWDGQDGQKHFTNEIIADKVSFLDRQGAALPGQEGPGGRSAEGGADELGPDDIPF